MRAMAAIASSPCRHFLQGQPLHRILGRPSPLPLVSSTPQPVATTSSGRWDAIAQPLHLAAVIKGTPAARALLSASYSAGGAAPIDSRPAPSPYPTALNLHRLVGPAAWSSVQQLPEVQRALTPTTSAGAAVDDLRRAADVFDQIFPGGEEHRAVLALLADRLNEGGSYVEAADALGVVLNFMLKVGGDLDKGENCRAMQLARCKALWNAGRFQDAVSTAESLLISTDEVSVLSRGVALTAVGLTRLLLQNDDGDAYGALREATNLLHDEYRDLSFPSKDSAKAVELGMAVASAYGNLGIAELASSGNKDGSIQFWEDGLDVVDSLSVEAASTSNLNPSAQCTGILADCIRARLCCNVSWCLLFADKATGKKMKEDDLTKASEYSRRALKIYDDLLADETTLLPCDPRHHRASMARALGLVASCYAQAGSAVTAEGLFQSAVEAVPVSGGKLLGPLSAIDAREIHLWYSDLCDNWEKRSGDADSLRSKAANFDAILREQWKEKPGFYSGLWLFSTLDFVAYTP